MNWVDAIGTGGAWMLALGIGFAVLRGDLRLGREVTERDATIAELRTELKATALKAEQTLQAEQAATRAELAELRKTNAALVASLAEARA